MNNFENANAVRETVATTYTKAVTTENAGCCGSNSGCGCGTTTTAPTPKGVAVKSAGYVADELAEIPADAVRNSFGCGNPVALAGIEPSDTVLDLGSGAGIDVILAAKRTGDNGRVIGVDMTDAMLKQSADNVAEAGLDNVDLRKGIIEDLPVDDASVDWAISNCVINLSPEKPRVFAEIARVLKPGGQFSVSDIVVDSLPDAVRQDERAYCSCIGGAVSEAQYIAGLEEAGLTDVRVVDRIVYDAGQIGAIIESELAEDAASVTGIAVDALAAQAEGTVQSVRIVGRKAT